MILSLNVNKKNKLAYILIHLQDIERLQELYNKKHSELLSMKQQSEERQDQEFESLELEIMKLEEMQNKAR